MRFTIFTFVLAIMLSVLLKTSSADASRRIDLNVDIAAEEIDKDVSSITILPEPSYSVEEGQDILIPLSIYRGSTLKRTVYVWIEDNGGKRISSKSKHSLPERFTEYNVSAMLNFSACADAGDYKIVAEGLGLNLTQTVSLVFPDCDSGSGEKEVDEEGISFSVMGSEDEVRSGVVFTTRIIMKNPSEEYLDVVAWSYVYRGAACFSGEREQNRKTINLPAESNVTFDLENTVIAEPGNYSLKIKLLRSDRKTPVEFTLPISVVSNSDDSTISEGKEDVFSGTTISSEQSSDAVSETVKTPKKRSLFDSIIPKDESVVYESSSAKARKITVYLVILALALVLVALILKRL